MTSKFQDEGSNPVNKYWVNQWGEQIYTNSLDCTYRKQISKVNVIRKKMREKSLLPLWQTFLILITSNYASKYFNTGIYTKYLISKKLIAIPTSKTNLTVFIFLNIYTQNLGETVNICVV